VTETPQRCSVCCHPARLEIEQVLVAGGPVRTTARRHGLSHQALLRHRDRGHVAQSVIHARAVEDVIRGDTLLEQVQSLQRRVERVLAQGEEQRDAKLVLSAARELRGILELTARVAGELQDGPTVQVNLIASPEWHRLRVAIVAALKHHPEARQCVVDAIASVEETGTLALPNMGAS
jgi:hypothetical protein